MKHTCSYVLFFLIALTNHHLQSQEILTFDFNGLSGNEVSENSNYNDPNLIAATIKRGSGLNAANNSNRFNAKKWNTGDIHAAIADNDYMEFTITPHTSVEFTISSIAVNVQRSGTGPRAIALRSSLDGYASNLDTEKTINDSSSVQQFTFTFTQTASSSAVTYRFYLYHAESVNGSGGLEGTGNEIVVHGTAVSTSTNPTVNFDTTTSEEIETDSSFTTTIPVTLTNYNTNITVHITVDANSTAEAGDYTLNTNSLTFTQTRF